MCSGERSSELEATFESAAAAGTNPLGPLKGFTVVTQGDATFGNSGEIEGSLAVGGNLAFQQYNLAPNQDGSALPIVDGQSNVGLFVGGTVTFPGNGKFDINGGGVARITGTSGMSVSADQRLYAGANQQAYDAAARKRLVQRPQEFHAALLPQESRRAVENGWDATADAMRRHVEAVLKVPSEDRPERRPKVRRGRRLGPVGDPARATRTRYDDVTCDTSIESTV